MMKKSRAFTLLQDGKLDCVRFLFDKVKPSRETEEKAARQAAGKGRIDILRYFVEERKIPDVVMIACVATAMQSDGRTRLPQILSRRGESAS